MFNVFLIIFQFLHRIQSNYKSFYLFLNKIKHKENLL